MPIVLFEQAILRYLRGVSSDNHSLDTPPPLHAKTKIANTTYQGTLKGPVEWFKITVSLGVFKLNIRGLKRRIIELENTTDISAHGPIMSRFGAVKFQNPSSVTLCLETCNSSGAP